MGSRAHIFAAVIGVICLAAQGGQSEEFDVTESDLVLLPRPRLMTFLAGKYEVDIGQTKAHYDQLFAGASATQALQALKAAGRTITFTSKESFNFFVQDNAGPIVFSGLISLRFEEGVFQEAQVIGAGLK